MEQASAVFKVLEGLGAKDKPVITALNKIDKISDKGIIDKISKNFDNAVAISALKQEGLSGLTEKISGRLKIC